ncbi:NifU-like protein [Zancudomyces culisetae]|uniref:NifU-like protein n=1 Tax=Zancudomyces culisetae TaxID=1213189 RepID=A0A1R1PIW2_ZANCU|nr:NifU-like protein [Zancudomyces culisetae]|eukprot:OMH80921.1 NifU-like protein [Zancudomyces culisetae]
MNSTKLLKTVNRFNNRLLTTGCRTSFQQRAHMIPAISIRSISLIARNERSLFIQVETTPNQNALKFIPGTKVLESTSTVEFTSPKASIKSPLASRLFSVSGVETVLFGSDFISISKNPDSEWHVLKPEIFSIIIDHLSSGQPILSNHSQNSTQQEEDQDLDDIDSQIKELIETRIRPSIQEDGGDLDFVGFDVETGVVQIVLRGACRGCSSSEVTLKNGIESMLTYYIPEVTSVVSVQTELEALNFDEFNKFQSKLNKDTSSSELDA